MNWNIYSDYNWSIDEAHNFKTMLDFRQMSRRKLLSATGYGLQAEELPELNLISGVDGQGVERAAEISGYRNQWSTAGFLVV